MMLLWSRLVLPSVFLVAPLWAKLCPGGKVRCPDNMTCCPLANHEFGCCAYPEAQCCDDHVHCCPHDMTCDERRQACVKKGFPALFFAQVSVKPEMVEEMESTHTNPNDFLETNHVDGAEDEHRSNTCPDGHECPGSFTCCKMFRGHYGCCPYSDAKCCMDGFHCCPHGSQCDPNTGGCLSGGNWLGKASLLMSKKLSRPTPSEVADPGGKCPDGHPCPEKLTCCKVLDGGYGCCPYSNAICCTDLIHCCPKNTNCNTSTGTCDGVRSFSVPAYSLATLKLSSIPDLSEDTSASEVAKDLPDDICPDQRSRCNPGNTCCQLDDGSYGCCPFPQASCCPDHKSCCPTGYKCTNGGKCERLSTLAALPFLSSVPQQTPTAPPRVQSPAVEEEFISCPDGSKCPDQNTCCSISATSFGCCPMPLATCCGDMEHCCPHGYLCADQGCERLEGDTLNKTRILHNIVKRPTPPKVQSPTVEEEFMVCQDGSMCPDRNTCCRLSATHFGCCPLPLATCCSDMRHCCPHGYTCFGQGCVIQEGDTLNKTLILDSTLERPSPPKVQSPAVEEEFMVCPDGSMCPDRNTCCRLSATQFGCCPLPLATCCSDMRHCCPHGYTCFGQGCVIQEGDTLNKTLILDSTLKVTYPKVMVAP